MNDNLFKELVFQVRARCAGAFFFLNDLTVYVIINSSQTLQ